MVSDSSGVTKRAAMLFTLLLGLIAGTFSLPPQDGRATLRQHAGAMLQPELVRTELPLELRSPSETSRSDRDGGPDDVGAPSPAPVSIPAGAGGLTFSLLRPSLLPNAAGSPYQARAPPSA